MQKLFEFRTLILNSNLKVKILKLEKDKKEKKRRLPNVKESPYEGGKAETINLVEFL